MSAPSWKSLSRAYERAAAAPPEDRGQVLEELADESPELAREVASLLEARGELGGFLRRPLVPRPLREEPPTSIGPYRIQDEIGSGGMSRVFAAMREDGVFQQEVAIKLFRSGLQDAGSLERFKVERQILASLRHPNIARLYDGGATDDGRPYFVMERVRGVSIDTFCEEQGFSTRARIQLLLPVCDAVHYAHRNLIVHRDLKPNNVLVTQDEGQEPVPKLLDFGIAKELAPLPRAEGGSPHTRTAWMTVEFASPEQIRGERVTTSSDVYSLGVVLAFLVTGGLPYPRDAREGFRLARAVCDTEPTFASPLDPDLESVLRKALNKEPGERYTSVQALAADLRRYLQRLPVEARGDGPGYRLAKFVRRNRALSVASTLAVAAVLAGTVGVLWKSRQVAAEAARVQRVNRLLENVVSLPDPDLRGDSVRFVDVLDVVEEMVERDFADDVVTRARLHGRIGTTFLRLGQPERARIDLERAAALTADESVASNAVRADALLRLAELEYDEGNLAPAAALAEEALARYRRESTASGRSLAESLELVGLIRVEEDRGAEAEELLRQALGVHEGAPDADPSATARCYGNLGYVLQSNGDFEGATVALQDGLAHARHRLGPHHLRVAALLTHLGRLQHMQGRLDEASASLTEGLEILEERLSAPHPEILGCLNLLCSVSTSRNELERAEAFARRAAEMARELRARDPGSTTARLFAVQSLDSLALALRTKREYAEAEGVRREILAEYLEILGEGHPFVASARRSLATVLFDLGSFEEAEELIRFALDYHEASSPQSPAQLLLLRAELAQVLLHRGELARAWLAINAALERGREAEQEDSWPFAHAQALCAEIALGRSDRVLAYELANESVGVLEGILPDENTLLAHARGIMVCAAPQAEKASASSEGLFERALEVLEERRGEAHPWTRRLREHHAVPTAGARSMSEAPEDR